MKKLFTCTVYGVWQPEPEDSIFYYSGDTAVLTGDSIEEVKSLYDNIAFQDGVVKEAANVFCDGTLVAVISPMGIAPPDMAWQVHKENAAKMALKNACELNADASTIEAIQHGNIHEIVFFSDPRVLEWRGNQRENYQFSLFD